MSFSKLRSREVNENTDSSVSGTFDTIIVASTSDTNPIHSKIFYYGKLEDIVELNYYGRYTTLFKCKWENTLTGPWKKTDALGFTLINFTHAIHAGDRDSHELYISASIAQMVYYVDDCQQ